LLAAAADERVCGYTGACSRTPIPLSPRFAICATAPGPDRRRALELLAGSPTGCTKVLLFAYGITVEILIEDHEK